MSNILQWLKEHGLGKYADLFVENEIDLDVLPHLTEADIDRLSLPMGSRRKLLVAITTLSSIDADATDERSRAREAGSTPSEHEKTMAPQAERRQLTVMFCDLVGSTALSERLDPEDLRELMAAYQKTAGEVIERYEGHVAQYLGDGVMCYFGWPKAHEDDAQRAIRAGLEIVEAVGELEVPERLSVRVGISTGPVVVGETGAGDASIPKAAVGGTPNLAARIQGLAAPNTVAIAEATRRLARGVFELEDLGPQALKGVAGAVSAYRVLGESAANSRFEAAQIGGMTPLVGREIEIAMLLERWDQAKDGEGQVVLLSGEPGIGKSRITQELHNRIAGEPHTRLRYQCSPYHSNSAFYPFIDQFERAAGFDRKDAPDAKLDKLENLLAQSKGHASEHAPLIAAMLSLPLDRYPPLNLSPQRQKVRTIEVLIDQVVGLTQHNPALVIFEDAHWVDPTTLEAVGAIVDQVRATAVLLVITCRPGFASPWGAHSHVTTLTLNRLSRRQGADMVAKVTGGKALPDEVFDQIVAKTDGVPLFVEELTKTVLEAGFLREAGDHYILEGPLPPLAIPATLQDSLMARLDRFAPVKEVAQIGACIGREFSHELLAAVSPVSANELQDGLQELVTSELVFRRGTPPDVTYTFKHALVQDAAYESLLKSKRQQLHGRIANVLEERFPQIKNAQPEQLAHHYTEAGLAQPGLDCWLRAGEHAARQSAHSEAIAHLRRGLILLDALPKTSDRIGREIALQTALAISIQATKGFAAKEAEAAYVRAEKLCDQSGETAKLFTILLGLFHCHFVAGEINISRKQAERCYAIAGQEADPALRLAAHHALCGSDYFMGQFNAACDHLDHALNLEEQVPAGSLPGLVDGVFVRAYGCHAVWHLGDASGAVRLIDNGIRHARSVADPFRIALALDYAAMLHQFNGNHHIAGEQALEAMELCSQHHFVYYLAWATIIHGWVLATEGRVDDGLAQMQSGLADLEATGAGLRRPYYLGLIADAHAQAGRPEQGLSIVDQAIAVAESMGERWRDADLQRIKGKLLLAHSSALESDAEACFLSALQIARNQKTKPLELRAATSLAYLWQSQGKRQDAHDLLFPVYDWFTEGFDTADLKDAKALLEELK